MNLLISKDTPWSKTLFTELSKETKDFFWLTEFDNTTFSKFNPEWIFFFHWSEIVPEHIFKNYRCVIFHPANLPHGRGGSPIHNQILEGINFSRINAIEMSNVVDGGGIYCSKPVTFQGSIDDIWNTLALAAKDLILKCVRESLKPTPQTEFIKPYKRKKDNHIIFSHEKDLSNVYDQIRILDSDYYPNAYIEIGNFRLEFTRAKLNKDKIISDVTITKK